MRNDSVAVQEEDTYAIMNPTDIDNKYKWWRCRIFAVTWVTYAAYYFTRKSFSVAKVGIIADSSISISNQAMGNIDALFLTAYAVGQFVFGVLADKYGTRRLVFAGLLLSSIVSIATGFSSSVILIGSLMFIQGLCQSTGWAPLSETIGCWFSRKERGKVFGFWCTNYAVGGVAAAFFLGFMATHIFKDWRWSFFAPAFVTIPVCIIFFLLHRNKPEDAGLPPIEEYQQHKIDLQEQEASSPSDASWSWRISREIMTNPIILVLGLIYFLYKPIRYSILFWGPAIISQRLGISDMALVAVVVVSFEAAGVIGSIAAGIVSDKLFNSRRIPVCVICLTLLSIVLFFFNPLTSGENIVSVTVLLGIMGILYYGPDTIISSTAAVDFGTKSGASTATGFVNGLGSIGAIFGGLLPGYIENKTLLFSGYATVMLICAVLLIPFWNRIPRD